MLRHQLRSLKVAAYCCGQFKSVTAIVFHVTERMQKRSISQRI